jgi:hypothetical protein
MLSSQIVTWYMCLRLTSLLGERHINCRTWDSETVCRTEKLLGRAGREYVCLNVSVWTWLFMLLLNVDSHEWRMTDSVYSTFPVQCAVTV